MTRSYRPAWLRMLLGHRVLNGASVGAGLALLSVAVYWWAGVAVAASASIGMLIVSIGDQTSPARGKLRQLAPLLWLAAPMSLAVQLADQAPAHSEWLVGSLVCFGGFIGMLGTAWGARGAPQGFAVLLTIVFAIGTPLSGHPTVAWQHAVWFELGALLFAGYAVAMSHLLNLRYRTQALADALGELVAMLRKQGQRLAATADRRENPLRALMSEQAALADKLQTARDLVLDLPTSPRQLRLTGMLIAAVKLREQALACELELDMQPARGEHRITAPQAQALERLWTDLANDVDRVCWALLTGRRLSTEPASDRSSAPDPADAPVRPSAGRVETDLVPPEASPPASSQPEPAPPEPLRNAVDAMRAEMASMLQLAARVGAEPWPGLAERARHWPKFRTSMRWPLAPLRRALTGRSPVLRYALRATLALAVGYGLGLHLPWSSHPQWILLTIAVVMRTNIAQTLQRRNARLIGTLIGCVIATGLLSLQPGPQVQFLLIATAAGIAHAFVQLRYVIAATAASVLALVAGHLLRTSGEFALAERLADTVIGTAIAWAFSYVLPAWERRQLPALLQRLRAAQLRHAEVALRGVDLADGDANWRLARREVLESLAAIELAADRAHAEPHGAQPPLALLERVQLRSYRLLAQLGGVRIWRAQPQALQSDEAAPLMLDHLTRISAALQPGVTLAAASQPAPTSPAAPIEVRTETITPQEEGAWLLQRLHDAVDEARALGADLANAQVWEAARLHEKHR